MQYQADSTSHFIENYPPTQFDNVPVRSDAIRKESAVKSEQKTNKVTKILN